VNGESMSNKNDSGSSKMLKIFLYSLLASLATVLLPVIFNAIIPTSWGDGLAYKLSYPIAAAISALYITWRVEVEKKDLNDRVKILEEEKGKLEDAYNEKHKTYQQVVITEISIVVSKKYQSINAMREHCGRILMGLVNNKKINYTMKQMVEYVSSDAFNKVDVGSHEPKNNNDYNPTSNSLIDEYNKK